MGSYLQKTNLTSEPINTNINLNGTINNTSISTVPVKPSITSTAPTQINTSTYVGISYDSLTNHDNYMINPGSISSSSYQSFGLTHLGSHWQFLDEQNNVIYNHYSTADKTSTNIANYFSANSAIQMGFDISSILNNGKVVKCRVRYINAEGNYSSFSDEFSIPFTDSFSGSLSGYTPVLTTFPTRAGTFNNCFRTDQNDVSSYVTYNGNLNFGASNVFLDIYDATTYVALVGNNPDNFGSNLVYLNSAINYSTTSWSYLITSSRIWRCPVTATYNIYVVGSGGSSSYTSNINGLYGADSGQILTQTVSLNEGDEFFIYISGAVRNYTYPPTNYFTTGSSLCNPGGADTVLFDNTNNNVYHARGAEFGLRSVTGPYGSSFLGTGLGNTPYVAARGGTNGGGNSTYGDGGANPGGGGSGYGAGDGGTHNNGASGEGGGGFGTGFSSRVGCVFIEKP